SNTDDDAWGALDTLGAPITESVRTVGAGVAWQAHPPPLPQPPLGSAPLGSLPHTPPQPPALPHLSPPSPPQHPPPAETTPLAVRPRSLSGPVDMRELLSVSSAR